MAAAEAREQSARKVRASEDSDDETNADSSAEMPVAKKPLCRRSSKDDEDEEGLNARPRGGRARNRRRASGKGIPAWVWITGVGAACVAVAAVTLVFYLRNRVNLANLDKVKQGMSLTEVEAQIGPGQVVTDEAMGGQEIKTVRWKGAQNGFHTEVTLCFVNDRSLIGFGQGPNSAPANQGVNPFNMNR